MNPFEFSLIVPIVMMIIIIIVIIIGIKYNDQITTMLVTKPIQPNFFASFIEKIIGLNATEESISNTKKKLFNGNTNLWDPVEKLNLDEIKSNAAKIEIKIEQLKKDPKQIDKHLGKIFMLGFLATSIIIYCMYVLDILFSRALELPVYLFLAFLSTYFAIKTYYFLLLKDLIKLEIAKKKDWTYDPDINIKKYNELKRYFPEVFSKGNQNQYIEDQFWGLTPINNHYHYFYTGLFNFEIKTGNGKNKSVQKFTTHYFIFPLKKDINARFYLYPEGQNINLFSWFSKKEINVESNKFNKIFAFSYNGQKDEKAIEIVKTITPVMQEKLLKLREQKGPCEILFARNTVVFFFNKDILNEIRTDFKKSTEINADDLKEIDDKLSELIKISEEMSKYLD